ncbi:synaptotagmin-like protein 4 isoform X1 [Amphiprion ocellaris]|uniref:Synaptotagmin-like protein 4 n=1 Tax=Amphiprion ocellaris TaxID=80972 RepID=A0A3Q1BN45_AMPOC|nr:synaptotagmin-like protein 4 isoform X1 [Amphiprion ocellaris]XP_054872326.1 synaptotagmin-like protein 4 isoform X1 [Amphiprion ocellaris]XP_054872327.1 synaptotagmin-like protein 4 isoform X1 [Amphiprion ocellaris]XP_054872328.1 synaptotagmin-like protein 4 isoform X1 [Amphiprion ocellaris]XP_054872329.1 synaptotagmin-like protein 4 isoform X1 [Amphiprion ocellaris]XP_054872330.1 synaptotagmin-like protein 4 isoform X1 [Amphiprion ocellaris]
MPEAADMINLGFLSDSERELILEVLRRDEELRLAEEQRVRKLKTELMEVKRKGAKRGSGRYSQHVCGRCLVPLTRLAVFNSQCRICNHYVCRNCRKILPNNSWVCSVCAKESELKKRTGDWFYDQRYNRFSTAPGHDLVRVSLKKRLALKKHETVGQTLLRSTEINPHLASAVSQQPKQKNLTFSLSETSGSITSRESVESRDEVWSRPIRSDTESVENASITSSKTETESGRVTPEQPRTEQHLVETSPAGSHVSSLTVAVRADTIKNESANLDAMTVPEVKPVNPNPEQEVDRLFKKSVRRAPKPAEYVSTLDLRDERNTSEVSMGNRSRSVPGLDLQANEEEEEEEEDIDSLVSFHRRTMASSSSSLRSSKSTLGSLMSIYSEAGDYDSVEVSGDIIFSMSYEEHTQSLQVFIKECHKLAFGDASRQLSNPYVKCYLLPDKSRQSKRKTNIKRNTINPIYNETLKYSISRSQLFTRSMLISVWHHGRLSRNTFLGEVEIPLDCRDLDSPQEDCVALMPKAASVVPVSAFAQYKGELVISLKYVPPKKPTTEKIKGKKAAPEGGGELHVVIKEAKNLMAMKPGGTSDSFVKGYLFPAKAKTTKRKTSVVRKNLNPHYDQTFVYKDLALEQLKGMCLELTVWDREAMLSNEFLGGVRLSSGRGTVKIGKEEMELDSVGEEVSLWQKMMQYPDSWAEGTLPLRSTMGKAKGK